MLYYLIIFHGNHMDHYLHMINLKCRTLQMIYLQLNASVTAIPSGLVQEILQRLQHLKDHFVRKDLRRAQCTSVKKQWQRNTFLRRFPWTSLASNILADIGFLVCNKLPFYKHGIFVTCQNIEAGLQNNVTCSYTQ